jgi:hypothetical protein
MPPLEDNFQPAKRPEQEARPAEPPERPDFNRDAARPNEKLSAREVQSRNFGDVIPNQRETGEASDSAGDRLRESAGLEKVPDAGSVQYSVKLAEMQAQRAEGVSRAQNIAFVGANGESVVGAQFTKQDGTYLKTTGGDTYRVEANTTGGFDLNPVKGDGQQFSAVQMKVLTDAFVLRAEKFSAPPGRPDDGQRAVLDALNGGVKRGETADFSPTARRTEMPQKREAVLPPSERAPNPGANAIPAERVAAAQAPGRPDATSRENATDRALHPEQNVQEQLGAARGGNDLFSQFVNLLVEKLSPSPDHIVDGKHQSLRDISASIVEMYQSRPELAGVLGLRTLIARQVENAPPLSMSDSGSMPGAERVTGRTFEARVSAAIAAALNNFQTQKENAIAAAAQSRAQSRLESGQPENTSGLVRDPQFHVGDAPTLSPAGATIVQGRIDIDAPNPEPRLEPTQENEPLPFSEAASHPEPEVARVESPEEMAERARLQALALEQERIAAEKLALEQQENEEAERLAREEAERQEREAIKQRIQKRDDERRRRYLVKDKDTFDSIAVKQLRDVRLSALIYDINKHLLPVKTVRGKQVRELRARMIIFLPTAQEIEKFRNGPAVASVDALQVQQLLEADAITGGANVDTKSDIFEPVEAPKFEGLSAEQRAHVEQMLGPLPVAGATAITSTNRFEAPGEVDLPPHAQPAVPPVAEAPQAVPSAQLSKAKTESLTEAENKPDRFEQEPAPVLFREIERTAYTVRLGDTLKSISMRHPGLEDVALWSLLAEVNALSTVTDARGNPETKLVRGMRLLIPTAEEVVAHKERRSQLGNSVPSPRITGV